MSKSFSTKVNEKEAYSILRKLEQTTRCKWKGTGLKPAANIPYRNPAFSVHIKHLTVCDGVLLYHAAIGDDSVIVDRAEFLRQAAANWGK